MKNIITTIAAATLLTACTTNPYTGESQVAKTAWTTGIGTAVGAGTGALIGGKKGALIGAGAGAAVGIGAGAYMDIQAAKLRQELLSTGVQVKQNGNEILLIMPGNITFGSNQATIDAKFEPVLASVAKVKNGVALQPFLCTEMVDAAVQRLCIHAKIAHTKRFK